MQPLAAGQRRRDVDPQKPAEGVALMARTRFLAMGAAILLAAAALAACSGPARPATLCG
jgi:hypothetical protein